jgi:hypothetical protein
VRACQSEAAALPAIASPANTGTTSPPAARASRAPARDATARGARPGAAARVVALLSARTGRAQ